MFTTSFLELRQELLSNGLRTCDSQGTAVAPCMLLGPWPAAQCGDAWEATDQRRGAQLKDLSPADLHEPPSSTVSW